MPEEGLEPPTRRLRSETASGLRALKGPLRHEKVVSVRPKVGSWVHARCTPRAGNGRDVGRSSRARQHAEPGTDGFRKARHRIFEKRRFAWKAVVRRGILR